MSGGIEDPKAFVAKMADVVAQTKSLAVKVARSVKSATDGGEDETEEKSARELPSSSCCCLYLTY
jgi:hypothetical protein